VSILVDVIQIKSEGLMFSPPSSPYQWLIAAANASTQIRESWIAIAISGFAKMTRKKQLGQSRHIKLTGK